MQPAPLSFLPWGIIPSKAPADTSSALSIVVGMSRMLKTLQQPLLIVSEIPGRFGGDVQRPLTPSQQQWELQQRSLCVLVLDLGHGREQMLQMRPWGLSASLLGTN